MYWLNTVVVFLLRTNWLSLDMDVHYFGFKERNKTLYTQANEHKFLCWQSIAKEQQLNEPSELEFLQLQLKPY